MAHIHTNFGEYDHTVSAYILIIDSNNSEPKIMLHRHKKLGKYLQFGGHIELNENPWQALNHELMEESGYQLSQLKIMQPKNTFHKLSSVIVHPIPFSYNSHFYDEDHKHLHTDVGYLLIADSLPRHKPRKGESNDIVLFGEEEIEQLPVSDIYTTTKQLIKYAIQIYNHKNMGWEIVKTSQF